MEDQSIGSTNSIDSAYDSETKQQHDFHEGSDGVGTGNFSSTAEGQQKGSVVRVMGAFLNKQGSVASMASMFERSSLADSHQSVGETRARCPAPSTNLSTSNTFQSSTSFDHAKSPSVSSRADKEYDAEDDDDVFSGLGPELVDQRTSLFNSMTTPTSNTSQPPVSEERKHSISEDKPSTSCSKQSPVEKPEYSFTRNVATKSGQLWSAPRKRGQVRNTHPSSYHPSDQPSADSSSTIVPSTTRSRALRQQRLSYDTTASLGLSSATSQSSSQGIKKTFLKKSYTIGADIGFVQAPKVTVTISSKEVDHCELDTLARYKQTSPATVQVAGDSDSD